jgi:hypothetical protein
MFSPYIYLNIRDCSCELYLYCAVETPLWQASVLYSSAQARKGHVSRRGMSPVGQRVEDSHLMIKASFLTRKLTARIWALDAITWSTSEEMDLLYLQDTTLPALR